MNLIIISAFRESETLMNKYRHKLLKNYLKAEGYDVINGRGKADGQEEPLCIIKFEGHLIDAEIDMLETLATLFDQDYYVVVENDVAYQYGPGGITEMGVFWQVGDACPDSVVKMVAQGVRSGSKEGAYTFINGDGYFGIRTPEMAKADAFTAAELAGGCKCSTPRVRSFIYGTPEWLERSAAAARSYKY